jgi:plasmid stability protein
MWTRAKMQRGAGEEIEDFGFHDGSVLLEFDGKESNIELTTFSLFLCFFVVMKTVNLTMEEALWRRARMRAAERDMSASALMREALQVYLDGGEASEKAMDLAAQDRAQRERLVALFDTVDFELGERPTREALHER